MFKRFAKVTVGAIVIGATGLASYDIYNLRNPPPQMEFDEKKKTLAILGTGWGATSILKDLDTSAFNVVVVSPRNYFLFTPLLPSTTVGTVELRSIMQPIRHLLRLKTRQVMFVEGACSNIDTKNSTIHVDDETQGLKQTISYDYLVIATGAETATFGIPGVKENACFLKESWDAKKIRTQLMDCIENASFPGQSQSDIDRLLHFVVVGGGPTGVEYAAELHDFLVEDLCTFYPELAKNIKITLIEALPNVLPMFSKSLIEYTERHLDDSNINLMKNTVVKKIDKDVIHVLDKEKNPHQIPYGLLVWAAGNTPRPVIQELIKALPEQNQRRGLVVDEFLRVKGTTGSNIFALGDCTATKFAPTAQVASSQGSYLAKVLNTIGSNSLHPINDIVTKMEPFNYRHLGALAYIGGDRAIADLPGGIQSHGHATNLFWKSAYISNLFAFRNRVLVAFDWAKKSIFGRDISRE